MLNLTLQLTPHGGEPLYKQIYTYIVAEIESGRLPAHAKLPSKRALAQHLGVSVNTVDTAYQMLVAEGYALSRAKSGFYAAQLASPLPHTVRPAAPAAAPAPRWRYDFGTGFIDTQLFPQKTWARLLREVMAQNGDVLNHGPMQGDENLRRAIADYLHSYRGVLCTPQQVVVGAGVEYLLGQLARLLRGSVFAAEDPGYARTGVILQNNQSRCVYVPVDQNGMEIQALEQSGADIAYVTPSHQFPTGVTMPMPRRTQLLQWAAAEAGRYIIEDDFDSEFRFATQPIPALQGLDSHGRVIYISTFSKSLAPGIRMAYMVLPPKLLESYRRCFSLYSCTVSRLEQQTVCRLIDEGHFARHLRRLRIAYRERRDVLVQALNENFGKDITLYGKHTGLHILAQLPRAQSEQAMADAAAREGVRCAALGSYYHGAAQNRLPNTVVLGYAGLTPPQLQNAAAALQKAWKSV